jgi:hypothetical protein
VTGKDVWTAKNKEDNTKTRKSNVRAILDRDLTKRKSIMKKQSKEGVSEDLTLQTSDDEGGRTQELTKEESSPSTQQDVPPVPALRRPTQELTKEESSPSTQQDVPPVPALRRPTANEDDALFVPTKNKSGDHTLFSALKRPSQNKEDDQAAINVRPSRNSAVKFMNVTNNVNNHRKADDDVDDDESIEMDLFECSERRFDWFNSMSEIRHSTRRGLKVSLGRDPDDFRNIKELENNHYWKQVCHGYIAYSLYLSSWYNRCSHHTYCLYFHAGSFCRWL